METKKPGFWWMKPPQRQTKESPREPLVIPKLDLKGLHPSASFTDILQKDGSSKERDSDVDVDSIIEEINRVAAQSPLGPFEKSVGERSIDDIMKEAEKIYMESSKSFEQLSQRSKTSQNISDLLSSNSKMSTPTPKSISPLPMDPDVKFDYSSDYSEDFSQDSKAESETSYKTSPKLKKLYEALEEIEKIETNLSAASKSSEQAKKASSPSKPPSKIAKSVTLIKNSFRLPLTPINISPRQSPRDSPYMSTKSSPVKTASPVLSPETKPSESELKIMQLPEKSQLREPLHLVEDNKKIDELSQEIEIRNKLIKTLEDDNGLLKSEIETMKLDLQNTHALIERLKTELNSKILSSPEINVELDKALEELKDSKEINTSLQLQLDTVNKSHQLLKSSYDNVLSSNNSLERKVAELDSTLAKYKSELLNIQQAKTKLLDNEINLSKLLEIEKLQSKSLKLQNEKDARCIQDLNRQIKEMERIIARKHPDSVSALIVAAKEDATDTNLTARKLLEDRIKILEQEVTNRDAQSSKVFLEIQEKFNQMKNKYESHIEDLELHVSDLKGQLKRTVDTYDVYTQTFFEEKIPQKETYTIAVQTDAVVNKTKSATVGRKMAPEKDHHKEDAHLLATIRGLQTDLSNKEKVIVKLQKEVEEMRKTNRRLQKEREGSLRNLSDKKDFRSYPEKLASHSRSESVHDFRKDEELQQLKIERDRLKQQLARLEDDYQGLKKKRLDDLTALQEAHEREVGNYVSSVTPLREQLELQQVSISTLQTQLTKAKEELAVVTVERDHLNNRLLGALQCGGPAMTDGGGDGMEVDGLLKKISYLEKRYEEREYRLRAIIQSLAQKSITNRSCEQCAERQQQLIGYKVELDQLLATVRALNKSDQSDVVYEFWMGDKLLAYTSSVIQTSTGDRYLVASQSNTYIHVDILLAQYWAPPFNLTFFSPRFGKPARRYTGGLFRRAFKRDLEEEDIYEVIKVCKSETNSDRFEKSWRKQIEEKGTCSLTRLLWQNFGVRFFILGLIQLTWKTISSIYEPEAIGKLVSYFNPKTKLTFEDAIFYACLMIGLKFVHALYLQNYFIYLQQLAIQIRNSLCSLVYRKSLRLSPAALHQMGLGNLITVMTRDVVVFEKSVSLFSDMWIEIIRIFLICYLIYMKMGVTGFVGIATMLLVLPAQVFIGKCIKNLRLDLSKKTDERLQSTQETLSAIKIIKMYTWEKVFVKNVEEKRIKEMRYLLKSAYLKSMNFIVGLFTSKIGLYALMMTYIAVTEFADAEVIFYVMRSFHDLKHCIGILIPISLGRGAEIIASSQRINKILNAEEVERDGEKNYSVPRVKASGVTVKVKDRVILKDITTEVKPGLTVVTGPLGCGKSTLLKLFLKDFPITEGKLLSNSTFSYCSQDSWLFPSSIKQNIVFGEPFDEARYNTVVKVCALDYDFNLFDHGDETIVSDGGKNLSGGQQARINLARAIYKKSEIYLLDNPLHSLDPHVQEYIYQNCIKGFLKDEQCVLVTHNLKHKNSADHLIVLKKGQIKFDGKPTDVKEEIIKEIEIEEEQMKEKDGNVEEDADEITSLIKGAEVGKKKVYSEVKKVGKVEFAVFKKYFRFGGGFLVFSGIALLFVITESSESFSSRLFTNWINIQQNISNFKKENLTTTNATTYKILEHEADWNIKFYSGMILGSFTMDLIIQYLLMNFTRKASVRLHNAMIERLSTAAMSFYDRYFIGNILNRFSQDLSVVDETLPMNINFFLMVLFACFGAIALVSTVSKTFLIPAVLLILCLYMLRVIYMPTARSLKRLEAATRSPLIGHLNASIEGLTTIRASKVEHILAQEFDTHQDLYTSANYMTFCVRKAFAFFMDILSALFVSFIVGKLLFWGAGELSGDVGLAITKASTLAFLVQWALIQWSDLENDMTHVERVLEYTEVPQDNYEGKSLEHWPSYGGVTFNDVSLTYKLERVLKDVTFEVKPKHKIGIVGRTGAGKSSIIATLFRLYNYEGAILIDNVNIKTLSLEFLRERISIIPQDPILFQGTIRHNLDPLNRYTDEEIWLTLEKVHMKEHIPSLELIITDHGSNFSTGQRQLICLARAIIKKNKIVVLDEATANMDPETEFLVQKTIANNFSNCTVFIIAHRLQSVLDCNRILVMDRGQVVEYADPLILMDKKDSYFAKMLASDNSQTLGK